MSVKPISPNEAQKAAQNKTLPDEVVKSVNELLVENIKPEGRIGCTIKLEELVNRILSKFQEAESCVSRDDLFDNHWLDIEYTFRKVGWSVTFNKTEFGDAADSYFSFIPSNTTMY